MRFRTLRVGLAAFCLIMLLPTTAFVARGEMVATPVSEPGTIVETASGPVRGTIGDTYRLFQGIPFAAPPVGELRWQSPRAVAPWSEPLDATAPGSWCMQPAGVPGSLGGGSEDCLFLNVTVPRSASPEQPVPVMVWIHGGGFLSGAGSILDPRRLAVQGDVMVVTVNYRLGILGFFGYPGLTGSGAFGLEDQLAALRWVTANAAAFGGDPANITLCGESAGGMSVCALLTSPAAEGLFHKAIVQSGSCLIDWPDNGLFSGVEAATLWGTQDEAAGLGMAVAGEFGCADPGGALDCLRHLSPDALLASPLAYAFGLVSFGNATLPNDPAAVVRAGEARQMPIIMGITKDEGRTFVSFDPEPITAERYQALLADAFGDNAGEVAQRYPLADFDSPGLAWATAMTDRVWACTMLEHLELLPEQGSVFAYEFADRDAPALFPFPPDLPGGAYHGAEVAYLLDINVGGFSPALTPDQEQLANAMIGYWTNFARTGNPNGPGLLEWPPFESSADPPAVLSLAPGENGIRPVDLGAAHQCAFWEGLAEPA